MKKTAIAMLVVGGLAAFSCGQAFGQAGIVESAKSIMKDKQESVVWITGVGKILATKGGVEVGKQEVKIEALGTIVDKSGMAVVAYSHVDQTSVRDAGQMQLTNDISDVKMRLPDGTELPASIVMKDLDLDLAFIRPDADDETVKKTKFTPIDLSDAGTAGILDEVVVLSRLGKNMNNEPVVSLRRIASIVNKPRKYYIPAGDVSGGLPMFASDGKILGISVFRKIAGMMAILPAKDVLEIAKQALEKKTEAPPTTKPDVEKKDAEKAAEKPG
ncbi:MAG: trypsin-like peptidase domain-containing protein [Planctomycetes bacterium]|nr:trypsin-like peptidase domain-containing protein [Planctomycetota bacterium]